MSTITEDIEAEIPGSSAHGIAEFKTVVFDRASKPDTTHHLSNVRIDITSSTTAKATCSALAQYIRHGQDADPSSAKFTSGVLYACNMVRIGLLWKMKTWKAKVIYLAGW